MEVNVKKGFVEAKNAGSITQALSMVNWYPEENKGKMIKKGAVTLRLTADAFYCDECMRAYAIYEEK